MQTPQTFERALIEEAYASIAKEGVAITDDVSAVERLGRKVMLVPNHSPNFKITFPADLQLAEFVLSTRQG
jgi:2-C-methyl-D-erythritol 4-phosphate cytidylyltransferase